MIWVAIGIVWLACGVISYGLTFAHFQREYPVLAASEYRADRAFALRSIPLGPMALIVCLTMGGANHGFKWK